MILLVFLWAFNSLLSVPFSIFQVIFLEKWFGFENPLFHFFLLLFFWDISDDLFLIVLQLRRAFNTVCLLLLLSLYPRFCLLNFCRRSVLLFPFSTEDYSGLWYSLLGVSVWSDSLFISEVYIHFGLSFLFIFLNLSI